MQYSCHLDSCGDTTYFDPSTAAGELTSNSSTEDSYIVKLNSGGTFLWVVSTGSTSDDDYGESITVDSLRNAYVTGVFYDTVNFGATAMTANGGGGVFVSKLNRSDNFLWAKNLGCSSSDEVNDIAID